PAAVLSGALTAVSLTVTVTAALHARWDLAILAACGSSVTVGALAVSRRRGKSAGHRLGRGAAGSAAALAAGGPGAAPVALGWALRLAPAAARLGGLRPANGDGGRTLQLAGRVFLGHHADTGGLGLHARPRRPAGLGRSEGEPRGGGRGAYRSRASRGLGPGRCPPRR